MRYVLLGLALLSFCPGPDLAGQVLEPYRPTALTAEDYARAESYYKRALKIEENTLGPIKRLPRNNRTSTANTMMVMARMAGSQFMTRFSGIRERNQGGFFRPEARRQGLHLCRLSGHLAAAKAPTCNLGR